MAFWTQQSGGDKNLDPSSGDVVARPVTRNPQGSSGLAFSAATSTATALCGSVMPLASSSSGATPKYFESSSGEWTRQLMPHRVMQGDEIPSWTDFTTAGFGDDAQHSHCLECCRGNATADIADHGGLTGREAKYVEWIDARINAADDHRL